MVVVAAVAWVVSGPLRSGRREAFDETEIADRADLEARKEAKYKEIRDAELDWRTGKLSEADYRELDRKLRRDAIALLEALDDLPRSPSGRAH